MLPLLPFWKAGPPAKEREDHMALAHLIDGPSAAIVIGGTLLSTLMRSGWSDVATTLHMLAHLPRPKFAAQDTRGRLANKVAVIRKEGLLRAPDSACGDAEFDEATNALVDQRRLSALLESHERHKAVRQEQAQAAVRTLAQAAELAPAFGLVGTLASLSQMPSGGLEQGALTGAISMAVLTTLYGLLTANLIYAPLARAIERNAEREERERQEIVDWLTAQLAPAIPTPAQEPRSHRKAAA